jgi:hypothetical protein
MLSRLQTLQSNFQTAHLKRKLQTHITVTDYDLNRLQHLQQLLERNTGTNYYWRDTTRRSNDTLPPYPRMSIARTTSRRNTFKSKCHTTDRHYMRWCEKKWKKKGSPNHAIQP